MAEYHNSTPSTIHRVKSQVFDLAFRTPPQWSRTETLPSEMKTSSTRKLLQPARAASTPPERPLDTKVPLERPIKPLEARELAQKIPRISLSKRKSQYFDEVFASREMSNDVRSRSLKDSLITAEIKLNCGLESPHKILIDFAFLLSEVYQKPASCITVLISTDFSVILSNSLEPTYRISIAALEAEVAATKNKRTAGLVQDFMFENLNISANRGVLTFQKIDEENLIAYALDSSKRKPGLDSDYANEHKLLNGLLGRRSRRSRKSSIAKTTVCTNEATSRSQATLFDPHSFGGVIDTSDDTGVGDLGRTKVKNKKSLIALLGF